MAIGDELRELILVGASGMELRRKAIEEGMITLRMSGLRKVKDGLTSLEEVVRGSLGLSAHALGYNARFLYPRHGGIGSLPRALAEA